MQSWQYYPTGVRTAYKMACKLQRPITHICDPSAGKGHLIKHFQSGFVGLPEFMFEEFAQKLLVADGISERYAMSRARNLGDLRQASISAIEIDVAHHSYLRELKYQVLGYDFMKVQSLATVSTVVINPPFNAGAEHVLHAWNCLYDGEIVAIINAQSIKNPNSKEKRKLVELIDEFGSVEFLQDEFTEFVERTANVEIALIHLDKRPQSLDNIMDVLSTLSRGDARAYEDEIDPAITHALAIPSNFIENAVHNFNTAVDAARLASNAEALSDRATSILGPTLQEMQANDATDDRVAVNSSTVREHARGLFAERFNTIQKAAWSRGLLVFSAISDGTQS